MSNFRRVPPVAVVGVGALFPGSADAGSFWKNIMAGTDLLTDVPEDHWLIDDYYDPDPAAPDKTYCKRGGFLPTVPFDPIAYGIPPSVLPATDTTQLLALMVAKQVLDDAFSSQFQTMDKSRMSVILGVTSGQELFLQLAARLQRPNWLKGLRESGVPEDEAQAVCDRIAATYTPWQESSFPGLLGNVVAGRIANRFDLGGTNCVTDAACASSLSALSMGLDELYLGRSDVVIAGGADTFNDIGMYICFSKTPALSLTGDCRPFSDQADGTIISEGLGMFALKRLDDAERDGDRVYAVIKGLGSSSDGRAMSVYAPRASGQARALERAYQAAGYGPQTVELVEAHGTGTRAGDAAEFEGLMEVFGPARSDRQWCALGSIKSQIGHSKAAAGAAGLFKVVMALHHKVLPPTIKVATPSSKLEFEKSPFYLNTRARPWIRGTDHPRRASISSFGFGGSNFHVALEEYTGAAPRPERVRQVPAELVLFSAETAGDLARLCDAVLPVSGASEGLALLARRSQRDFEPTKPYRLAVVASDPADLEKKLRQAAQSLSTSPGTPFSWPGLYHGIGQREGKLAFLFPGQGSQYVGMGEDLAMAFEGARAVWDGAADRGLGVHQRVFPRPAFSDDDRAAQARALAATDRAQPAIGLASLAQLSLLTSFGLAPDCSGGHSFGEVTALHAAGALDPEAFLEVARVRGQLMAEAAASTRGAMIACDRPAAEVERLLAACSVRVTIANYNSTRQIVLSGEVEAIEQAEAHLAARGVRPKRLDVATAFHSHVVAASVDPFRAFLSQIPLSPARLPAFGNARPEPYPDAPDAVRDRLAAQVASPVRFVEMIEAMYEQGVRTFLEVGPGSVLSGLVDDILEGRPHQAIPMDRKGQHGLVSLWNALGQLAAAGHAFDTRVLRADGALEDDPGPREEPTFTVGLNGANYARPYPPAGGSAALPTPNPPRPASVPQQGAPVSPPALPPVPPASPEALEAYSLYQQAMTQSHLAYLSTVEESLSQSHLAFMRTMEAAFQAMNGMPPPPASALLPVPQAREQAAPPAFEPPVARASQPPVMQTMHRPPASVAQDPAPRSVPPGADLGAVLLSVISETTGYPVEMLDMGMALEADLGIDSIKRVEIFSTMAERVPALPQVEPADMARLRTLGEIAAFLQPVGRVTLAAGDLAPALTVTVPKAVPATDLSSILLSVISETTGYPVEMLDMGMALEADLGIDSIKRVEIFSTMAERVPTLPQVEPADMARLRTLGEIAGFLGHGPATAAPPAGSVEPSIPARPATGRFGLRAVTTPPAGFSALGRGPVHVTREGTGLAEALAARLQAAGIEATAVDAIPQDATQLIFLGGMRLEPEGDPVALHREAFLAARAIAGRARCFVVVQDSGGSFGLLGGTPAEAWRAGLSALAKTAALEWPDAIVKAIDLARGNRPVEDLAEILAGELLQGGLEIEVGFPLDGSRIRPILAPAPARGEPPILDESSVVVASGGARGVTARCLIELARSARPRFLLLGRSALEPEPLESQAIVDEAGLKRALAEGARQQGQTLAPAELGARVSRILADREVRATLAAIRQAGAEVRYAAVDIRDEPAVRSALDDVRADWGPVTALIHGAGVLADKAIAEKTPEQFDRVFGTKVLGLSALLRATQADPLEAIVLFSSVAARTGNGGQCDYAMANEVLNKVAQAEARRRGAACVVRALNWGPWAGGMVSGGLKAHFERQGVDLIPLDEGARMFVGELGAGDPEVEVVLGCGLPERADRVTRANLLVRAGSHPYLDDHRVQDGPVLPAAMAIQWFAAFAGSFRPGWGVRAIEDLRVLKGIPLAGFESGGDRFTLEGKVASDGPDGVRLGLELADEAGQIRYRARAVLRPQEPSRPLPAPPEPADLSPWIEHALYDGRKLFHGPAFQVIRSLDGQSRAGAVATLEVSSPDWSEGPWILHPALLDGALQVARVYGIAQGGRPSLPTRIEEVRVHGPLDGSAVKVLLHNKEVGQHRTISDVALVAVDGRLLVELVGLEMHMLNEFSAVGT